MEKLMTSSFDRYCSLLVFRRFLQFITFWRLLSVAITDKDHESSKLNICFSHCCSVHMQTVADWTGAREGVSHPGYITWLNKLSRWICWHFFFNLLAGPCGRAVDSMHKYMEYWLKTNTIPSDECQIYIMQGHKEYLTHYKINKDPLCSAQGSPFLSAHSCWYML